MSYLILLIPRMSAPAPVPPHQANCSKLLAAELLRQIARERLKAKRLFGEVVHGLNNDVKV